MVNQKAFMWEKVVRIGLILLLGVALGYAWKTIQVIQEDQYIIQKIYEEYNKRVKT